MDRYATLRETLVQKCSALLIDDPDLIRSLLDERDALREALELNRNLASQEWQEREGRRMAATDNRGNRLWFVSNEIMEVAREALSKKE